MNLTIPEDFTEFLYWIKERTEHFWNKKTATSKDDIVCEEWIHGAKWIGLKEEEISPIEEKYNIRFTPEHKEFLKILHTIDRKMVSKYESFEAKRKIVYETSPFFYNWRKDDKEIKEAQNYPYKAILRDAIRSNLWLSSWGKTRPKSAENITQTFADWYKKIPPLVPINRLQYVVGEPIEEMPVLSIYGSEMILLGRNIRNYLLLTLREHLGLYELVHDKEDGLWYPEPVKEFADLLELEYEKAQQIVIPVLGEMINY